MTNQVIASAKTLFSAYREALISLEAGLGSDFSIAVDLMKASTCLLYTSPSPRDATLSRMPSSA